MIDQKERKQIILHLYKLIKESQMFSDYPDDKIKEAAIKSEQKVFESAKTKDDYLKSMKSKFDKVVKNKKNPDIRSDPQSIKKVSNPSLDRHLINPGTQNINMKSDKMSVRTEHNQFESKNQNNSMAINYQPTHFNIPDKQNFARSDIPNMNYIRPESNPHRDSFVRPEPNSYIRTDSFVRNKSVNINRQDNFPYQREPIDPVVYNRDYSQNIPYVNNREPISNSKERSKSMNRNFDYSSQNSGYSPNSYNFVPQNQYGNGQFNRPNMQFVNHDHQYINDKSEMYRRNTVNSNTFMYNVNDPHLKNDFDRKDINSQYYPPRHNKNVEIRRESVNLISKTPDLTNIHQNYRQTGNIKQSPDPSKPYKQPNDMFNNEPLGTFQNYNMKRDSKHQYDFFQDRDKFNPKSSQNHVSNVNLSSQAAFEQSPGYTHKKSPGFAYGKSPGYTHKTSPGSTIEFQKQNIPSNNNVRGIPIVSSFNHTGNSGSTTQKQSNNFNSHTSNFSQYSLNNQKNNSSHLNLYNQTNPYNNQNNNFNLQSRNFNTHNSNFNQQNINTSQQNINNNQQSININQQYNNASQQSINTSPQTNFSPQGGNYEFNSFRSTQQAFSSKEPKKSSSRPKEGNKSTKKAKASKKTKEDYNNVTLKTPAPQKHSEPLPPINKRQKTDIEIIANVPNNSPSFNQSSVLTPPSSKNPTNSSSENVDLEIFMASTSKKKLTNEDVRILKESLTNGEEVQMQCKEIHTKHKMSNPKFTDLAQKLDLQRKLLDFEFYFMTWREVDDMIDYIKQYYLDIKYEIDKEQEIKYIKYDEKIEHIISVFNTKKKQDEDWVLDLLDE